MTQATFFPLQLVPQVVVAIAAAWLADTLESRFL